MIFSAELSYELPLARGECITAPLFVLTCASCALCYQYSHTILQRGRARKECGKGTTTLAKGTPGWQVAGGGLSILRQHQLLLSCLLSTPWQPLLTLPRWMLLPGPAQQLWHVHVGTKWSISVTKINTISYNNNKVLTPKKMILLDG